MNGFPVISSKVVGELLAIPWPLMKDHEAQAKRNHSQSVSELGRRGGLSASEAVAVLEDRNWTRLDSAAADERLKEIVAAYRGTTAFTLVELLVVIAIIGILAAIIVPQFVGGPKIGVMAGVITDFSFNEKRNIWKGEVTMEGTQQLWEGKSNYRYVANTRTFWVPNETALVREIERTMGHVVKLRYRRTGPLFEITGAEDTSTAEHR